MGKKTTAGIRPSVWIKKKGGEERKGVDQLEAVPSAQKRREKRILPSFHLKKK